MGIWKSLFRRSATDSGTRRGPLAKGKSRRKSEFGKPRGLRMERFEERLLLSIEPPSLVAIVPREAQILLDGQKLNEAPKEFLLRFNEGQTIDTLSLATGIQLVRSGGDGKFAGEPDNTVPDMVVPIGWAGQADVPNEVILRFAETLPDDSYRLKFYGTAHTELFGGRAIPLRNTDSPPKPFNGKLVNSQYVGQDETHPFSINVGALVTAVVPQPVSHVALEDAVLDLSPTTQPTIGNQLTLRYGSREETFTFGPGVGNIPLGGTTTATRNNIVTAVNARFSPGADVTARAIKDAQGRDLRVQFTGASYDVQVTENDPALTTSRITYSILDIKNFSATGLVGKKFKVQSGQRTEEFTFIAVGSAPTGNQVALGSTAETTRNNMAARINTIMGPDVVASATTDGSGQRVRVELTGAATVPRPAAGNTGFTVVESKLRQQRNVIEVYFNDDELLENSAETVSHYSLFPMKDPGNPADNAASVITVDFTALGSVANLPGKQFTVTNGGANAMHEFVTVVTGPNQILINTATDTVSSVAAKMRDAILNDVSLGVRVDSSGAKVALDGGQTVPSFVDGGGVLATGFRFAAGPVNPATATYDPARNLVTLAFDFNLDAYATGALRLRIGDDYYATDTWVISAAGDPDDGPLTLVDASTFRTVPAASIPEGDIFYVSHRVPLDRTDPETVTFEFDRDNVYNPSNVRVNIAGAVSAADVADAVAKAINEANRLRGLVVVGTPTTAVVTEAQPGIVVTPTSGLTTTEAGGSAYFTVTLATKPTADVTIPLTVSDATEAARSPASLTFTPANWNVSQTVTVTGVDDLVDDGNVPYTVQTGVATSTDANYSGMNAADVSITNTNDDFSSLRVTPASGLTTTEAGGTAQFSVVLSVQPSANVSVTVSSNDVTEGLVSSGAQGPAASITLTFTPGTWNVPQWVTVTGQDDTVGDGDVTYNVTLNPSSIGDANYAALPATNLSVINYDNEKAGITVTPVAGLATTEWGSTAQFTVKLDAQPSSNVTIGLSTGDPTEGTITSPASLTFTPGNWNTPQTVTVRGVNDVLVDGDIAYTIVTAPAVGGGVAYNGMNAADVSVTNIDSPPLGPVQTTDFAGLSQLALRPPDPIAAAGPSNLVAMVNSEIGIFAKDGTQIAASPLGTFFDSVDRDFFGPFDPWVVYDRYSDRYIVLAEETDQVDETYVLIGISTSNNPNDLNLASAGGDWYVYSISTSFDFGGGSAWLDYPKIAADADSLYVTGNYFLYAGGGGFEGVLISRLDKTPMLSGTLGTRTNIVAPSGAFTLQPAQSIGRPASDPQLFVDNFSNFGTGITVWELDDSNVLTQVANVGAAWSWSAVDAPQPGTSFTLDNLSPRLMNAVWRNNSLWTTHTVDVGGENRVRWYEVDTTGGSYSLVQQGDIDPGAGIHTFMPAIAVDGAGNMGITYTQSSTSQYATMMVTGRRAGDAPGTTFPGMAVRTSSTFYVDYRWGDYAGISVDPSDDSTFWAFHEYVVDNFTWGTWWGSFQFASVAGPGIKVIAPSIVSTSESDVSLGTRGAFSVLLDTQPAANVTIQVRSSNAAEGLVSSGAQGPAASITLTFTPGNWNVPQVVAVTGQEDALVDGNVGYTIFTDPATSPDPNYNARNAADVSARSPENS